MSKFNSSIGANDEFKNKSKVRMIPLQLVIIISVFAFLVGSIGVILLCGLYVH